MIQVIYQNATSQVRVNYLFSHVFDVQVGVHQGSVLSPILFIIVHENFALVAHGNFYMLMTSYR